jgi:hypothetical protein
MLLHFVVLGRSDWYKILGILSVICGWVSTKFWRFWLGCVLSILNKWRYNTNVNFPDTYPRPGVSFISRRTCNTINKWKRQNPTQKIKDWWTWVLWKGKQFRTAPLVAPVMLLMLKIWQKVIFKDKSSTMK